MMGIKMKSYWEELEHLKIPSSQNESGDFWTSVHGSVGNVGQKTSDETPIVPSATLDTDGKLSPNFYGYALSIRELEVLMEFLSKQYINYDNIELMTLVRVLRKINDELAGHTRKST